MRQNYLLPNIERWTPDRGPVVRLADISVSYGEKKVTDHL